MEISRKRRWKECALANEGSLRGHKIDGKGSSQNRSAALDEELDARCRTILGNEKKKGDDHRV
eukprot:scaffold97906_cov26-Attheya_sp.AAC.2